MTTNNPWAQPDKARRALVDGEVKYFADWQIIPWDAKNVKFRCAADRQRFVTREVASLDHRDEEIAAWRSASHLTNPMATSQHDRDVNEAMRRAAWPDYDATNDMHVDDDYAAYQAGYAAGEQGEQPAHCPYPFGTPNAKEWHAGYDEARKIADTPYPRMASLTGVLFFLCLAAPIVYALYRLVLWLQH